MKFPDRQWWQTPRLLFAVGFEDTFIPQARPGERALDEYELTQHYDQWESDIELIIESGATMVRWGIPWYRINPAPGVWDWAWLDKVADKFESLGVTPIIDLMHYGTPLWLEGEFFNVGYPKYVAEYSRAVAKRYAPRWHIYTPLNEPMLNALYCGLYGYWPPYGNGDRDFVRLIRALQRGIVLSQAAIREEVGPRASFVHVEASFRFIAAEPEAESEAVFLRERAFLVEDLVTGRVDDTHPMHSYLRANGFTDDDFVWSRENVALPDVMGVNYYPAGQTEVVSIVNHHSGGPNDFRPRVNAWTDGLVDVLQTFAARYGVPIFLTETSHVASMEEKTEWLRASVQTVRALREGGLPILGYTWWSIIDMIEWTYRPGDQSPQQYQLPMGLWALETQSDGVMRRISTPLVEAFRVEALSSLNGEDSLHASAGGNRD